jgi:hypothetical protein
MFLDTHFFANIYQFQIVHRMMYVKGEMFYILHQHT